MKKILIVFGTRPEAIKEEVLLRWYEVREVTQGFENFDTGIVKTVNGI